MRTGWSLASAVRSPLYPSDQSLSPLNFKIGAATVPSPVRRGLALVPFCGGGVWVQSSKSVAENMTRRGAAISDAIAG